MAAISVDVGTTIIKAVGYDDAGLESCVARRPAAVHRPRSGWAEQDMLAVWDAVSDAVRQVVASLKATSGRPVSSAPLAVDFVSVTAQGDGTWLVDGSGRPVGPALLWNDARAHRIVEGWHTAGVLEEIFRTTGSFGFAGLSHAQLRWMAEHQSEQLAAADTLLSCGGWVFLNLTGQRVMDPSDASAPFLDHETGLLSDRLVSLTGLQEQRRLMLSPATAAQRVAPVTPRVAADLGVPESTPVVLSAYDIVSTAVGSGAVAPGQAAAILGTTLCTEVMLDAPGVGAGAAGLTIALGLPDRWLRAFPTLAGGEVFAWFQNLLGLKSVAHLSDLAATTVPGADGLVFIPYLSPAGERAPFLDPMARGGIVGLSFEHGPEHVCRAVLEGLSYVVRDCLEAADAGADLRVSGGGAVNAVWLQLIADVTGCSVVRSHDQEVGARGAFLMGRVLTGMSHSLAEAGEDFVRHRVSLDPDPALRAQYDHWYEKVVDVRRTVLATGQALSTLRGESLDPMSAG